MAEKVARSASSSVAAAAAAAAAAAEEDGGSSCPEKSEFALGQVTVRLPLDTRPLPLLALALGFVPWVLPLALLADAAAERRFSTMAILAVLLVGTCVNEFVLKPCINQPRPPTTACRDAHGRPKPGMPSGHVFNSQTLATWYLLQVLFEYGLPAGETAWLAALLAASMPLVPWARWYNGDHTAKQVVATALGSTLTTIAIFVLYHQLVPERLRHAGGGGGGDAHDGPAAQQLWMPGGVAPVGGGLPSPHLRGAR